jgi:phosphoglycolate phosphatase
MKKKLIIFDLDGTLMNSIEDLAQSTNYALRKCGYPEHQLSEYPFFVGNGINVLFERALPEGQKTKENVLALRKEFLSHYSVHNCDKSKPYEGITDLLTTLTSKGYKLAVASNKYQVGTQEIVSHFFPTIRFDAVLGQRDGIPKKPDPTIVKDVMLLTGVEKEEVIYVGDSDVDMKTASHAGVTSVGVTWGFRSEAELQKFNPDFVIHESRELLKVCDTLN